jgi:adenylate cyclase
VPRHRIERPSLRITLLTLLVGLLLVTVISLARVAQTSMSRIVGDMESRLFTIGALAIGAQIDAFFAPAPPLLEDLADQARRGGLHVDDPDELSDYLVSRLRRSPTVGWLSYSDQATGRFVGAWRRDDGAIILNRSTPDVDGGRPTEVEVTPAGQRIPFHRDLPGGYDPRQRSWYQQAMAAPGVIWTEPFTFNEGAVGITAALALRTPGSSASPGVFTADFFLDGVSRFLGELGSASHMGDARLLVLSRQGSVVADSAGRPDVVADGIAREGGRSVSGGVGALRREQPAVVSFGLDGTRYVGAFQVVPVTDGPEWIAVVVMPEDEALGVVYENRRYALTLGLIFTGIAILLGSVLAHRVAGPLNAVARDLERVGRFELSPEPSPSSFVKEIAVVGAAVDRMKAGLRSFSHYAPTEIVRDLLARGEEARLGGEYRRLTIQFSDVEGYTRIGELMAPSELVEHIGEYLEAMTEILRDEQATIDKYLGDGILAFFNAPHDVPDHVARACRAAIRSQERLRELSVEWARAGKPVFRARIGFHVGEVLVGNIGTPYRFEYTVIGDAVNIASRLETLNKLYGTGILASEEVRQEAGPDFEWRTVDLVAVVGRESGTLVCELLGERGAVDPRILRARDVYEQALEEYLAGRFAEAVIGFGNAAVLRPGDLAAVELGSRAEALARQPLPADWDGVYAQTAKL